MLQLKSLASKSQCHFELFTTGFESGKNYSLPGDCTFCRLTAHPTGRLYRLPSNSITFLLMANTITAWKSNYKKHKTPRRANGLGFFRPVAGTAYPAIGRWEGGIGYE